MAHRKMGCYLPLNGDGQDYSPYARHGAVTGCTFVDGKIGQCAVFDGDNYIQGGAFTRAAGDAWTIACWAMDTGTGLYGSPISRCDSSPSSGGSIFAGSSSAIQGWSNGSGTYCPASGAMIWPAGVWTHVAFTRNGASRRLYVNGNLSGADELAGSHVDPACGITVGRFYSDVNNYYWVGKVQHAIEFGVALTQTQVQRLMSNLLPSGL